MRKALIPALALPVLMLAACSQPGGEARLKSNEVLLQVSATGRAEVVPDEARITVGVSSIAATAGAASTANNAAMTRLTAALRTAGVAEPDIQTRNVSLARIDYGAQRGQFRAENTVEARIRDVAKAGAVITAATEAGGNVVSGPDLRVSNPDQADNPAYDAAYKAATARAETYAKAAGMKIARVLAIRDGGVSAPIPYGGGYGVELQSAKAMNVAPVSAGTDVREVRVEVDYALTR